MLERIKEHPIATAGVVILVVVIWYWITSGGSQSYTSAPTVDPSVVGAGTQFQSAQLAAAQHTQDLEAQLQAQAQHDTSQYQIAELSLAAVNNNLQAQSFKVAADRDVSLSGITAGREVSLSQISAGRDVAITTSTLNAAVQQAGINAAVHQSEITAKQATDLATIQRDQSVATVNAIAGQNVQLASINANTQQQIAGLNASTQQRYISASESVQTQSWWDRIFG